MITEDTDRYGAACGGSAVRGEQWAVYSRPPVRRPLSRWDRPAADAGRVGHVFFYEFMGLIVAFFYGFINEIIHLAFKKNQADGVAGC